MIKKTGKNWAVVRGGVTIAIKPTKASAEAFELSFAPRRSVDERRTARLKRKAEAAPQRKQPPARRSVEQRRESRTARTMQSRKKLFDLVGEAFDVSTPWSDTASVSKMLEILQRRLDKEQAIEALKLAERSGWLHIRYIPRHDLEETAFSWRHPKTGLWASQATIKATRKTHEVDTRMREVESRISERAARFTLKPAREKDGWTLTTPKDADGHLAYLDMSRDPLYVIQCSESMGCAAYKVTGSRINPKTQKMVFSAKNTTTLFAANLPALLRKL